MQQSGSNVEESAPSQQPWSTGPGRVISSRNARRRPWLRRTVVISLVVLLVVVIATIGIGWFFASQLLTVDNAAAYPVTVSAVDGDKVTLSRDSDTELAVQLGLQWDGGSAVLSNAVTVNDDSVVRTVTSAVPGSLKPGLHVSADIRVFDGDPKSSRGLGFDAVNLKGELGDLPAWFVPPTAVKTRTTWVIAVHGLGASRTETLRVLPAIASAGLPALVMSYRNDVGAPASPDNYYHLGDTEWRDVAAGVAYAKAHGATGVVLYGWSMGGALNMTALRRMPAADAALIRAVVLDSANIDWSAVLEFQGAKRHLPGFVTWTAERFIEWRADLSLNDFDQRPYASQLKAPALIFIDTQDQTVPNGPAKEFAAARPDLVTLVTTTGGGHTGPWNTNPTRYEAALTTFLGRIAD